MLTTTLAAASSTAAAATTTTATTYHTLSLYRGDEIGIEDSDTSLGQHGGEDGESDMWLEIPLWLCAVVVLSVQCEELKRKPTNHISVANVRL